MINIDVAGTPIPWQRPGQRSFSGKVIRYDKQAFEKESFRQEIKRTWQEEPLKTAIRIEAIFYKPIPTATSKKRREQMILDYIKPMGRPDLDNYVKFAFDAMNGLVYEDDAQITEMDVRKQYASRPRTIIKVIPLSSNPEQKSDPIRDDPAMTVEFIGLDDRDDYI